jgi:hypothetical protein
MEKTAFYLSWKSMNIFIIFVLSLKSIHSLSGTFSFSGSHCITYNAIARLV